MAKHCLTTKLYQNAHGPYEK